MNATSLLEEIEKNNLKWHGHVMQIEEEKRQKKILFWQSPGKRPVGCPQKGWMNGIEKVFTRKGTSHKEGERKNKYNDIEERKRFVKFSPSDR